LLFCEIVFAFQPTVSNSCLMLAPNLLYLVIMMNDEIAYFTVRWKTRSYFSLPHQKHEL